MMKINRNVFLLIFMSSLVFVLPFAEGELHNKPKVYESNVDDFIKFLNDDGIGEFKKNNKYLIIQIV